MELSDLGRLERKVDAIATKLEALNVSMAGMMPRAEVDAEIAKRVSQEVYGADQRATNERLIRLESSPARLLAWISGGVGCLGVVLALASLIFFVLEFTLAHYKP